MKLFIALSLASLTIGQQSPCNQAPTRDVCIQTLDEHDQPCEWCEAGAIPSECMSTEQAQSLPAGVFDCSTPGFTFNTQVFGTARYLLKTTTPEPEISDICDASSKSLSGYIDIKGSDYDENGENKHLFFWMFEKRGDISNSTPVGLALIWIDLLIITIPFFLVCYLVDRRSRMLQYASATDRERPLLGE